MFVAIIGFACTTHPQALTPVADTPSPHTATTAFQDTLDNPYQAERERALLITGKSWTKIPEFRIIYPGPPFRGQSQNAKPPADDRRYYDGFARPNQGWRTAP